MSAADLPEDDELLAAELAFGLIDGAERDDTEARLRRDPAFAEAYARWQAHAADLFADAGEAPGVSVWNNIESRLPANETAPAAGRPALRWWQASTAIATAAAIALAVISVQRPSVAPPVVVQPAAQAPLVAVLTGKQGIVSVSYDRASGRLTLAPNGIDIGNRSPELWVIPADGKPRSLGVIGATEPGWRKAPGPAAATIAPGVTLAISAEPIGGSPTGQPTGPVILTGKVTAV